MSFKGYEEGTEQWPLMREEEMKIVRRELRET